jgi:hypothetical protein
MFYVQHTVTGYCIELGGSFDTVKSFSLKNVTLGTAKYGNHLPLAIPTLGFLSDSL